MARKGNTRSSVTLPPGKQTSFLCALMVLERLVKRTDATPSTLHKGIMTEALASNEGTGVAGS